MGKTLQETKHIATLGEKVLQKVPAGRGYVSSMECIIHPYQLFVQDIFGPSIGFNYLAGNFGPWKYNSNTPRVLHSPARTVLQPFVGPQWCVDL